MVSYAEVKSYLSKREIPQLFESLMAGLMYHRPDDHIKYMQTCLDEVKAGNVTSFHWNAFVNGKKRRSRELPPLTPKATPRESSAWADSSRQSTPLPPISAKKRRERWRDDDSLTPSGPSLYHNFPQNIVLPVMPVIFVLGGIGPKIDVLCEEVVNRLQDVIHISTCSVLKPRMTVEGFSCITSVPSCAVVDSVLQAMSVVKDARGVMVTGFPRNQEDINEYRERKARLDSVLLIDFEEEILNSLLQTEAKEGFIQSKELDTELDKYKQDLMSVAEYYDGRELLSVVFGEQEQDNIIKDLETIVMKVINYRKDVLPEDAQDHPSSAGERRKSCEFSALKKRDSSRRSAKYRLQRQLQNFEMFDSESVDVVRLKESNLPIFFLLGGPGSGKTTQCAKLQDGFGFKRISPEELVQQEICSSTERGTFITQMLEAKEKIPFDIVLHLMKESMLSSMNSYKGFIIVGFPRSVEEGTRFQNEIKECTMVLHLELNEVSMIQRNQACIAAQGLPDVSEEKLKEKIAKYERETKPLLAFFQDKIKTISAAESPEDVYANLASVVEDALGVKFVEVSGEEVHGLEENIESVKSEDEHLEKCPIMEKDEESLSVDLDEAKQDGDNENSQQKTSEEASALEDCQLDPNEKSAEKLETKLDENDYDGGQAMGEESDLHNQESQLEKINGSTEQSENNTDENSQEIISPNANTHEYDKSMQKEPSKQKSIEPDQEFSTDIGSTEEQQAEITSNTAENANEKSEELNDAASSESGLPECADNKHPEDGIEILEKVEEENGSTNKEENISEQTKSTELDEDKSEMHEHANSEEANELKVQELLSAEDIEGDNESIVIVEEQHEVGADGEEKPESQDIDSPEIKNIMLPEVPEETAQDLDGDECEDKENDATAGEASGTQEEDSAAQEDSSIVPEESMASENRADDDEGTVTEEASNRDLIEEEAHEEGKINEPSETQASEEQESTTAEADVESGSVDKDELTNEQENGKKKVSESEASSEKLEDSNADNQQEAIKEKCQSNGSVVCQDTQEEIEPQ